MMFKNMRKRKKAGIGISLLLAAALMSTTLYYAEETTEKATETPVTQAETQPATQAETQAATQAETQPATQAETQAPQTESQAPQTESQATQAETQAPQTESQAPQTESQASQTETQAPQTEPQTASETQAATETPAATETQVTTETEPQTSGETKVTEPQAGSETQSGTEGTGSESETAGKPETTVSETTQETTKETAKAATEKTTDAATEKTTDTSAETDAKKPDEEEKSSETETELTTEEVSESETEAETEAQTETETPAADEEPEMDENDTNNSPYATNEQLIAAQHITIPSDAVYDDFRFFHIDDASLVILRDGVEIKEETDSSSRTVGIARQRCIAYVLDSVDSWYYVESGTVRGFVKADLVLTGEKAQTKLALYTEDGTADERIAETIVPATDNAAIDYTKTTTQEVVVDKVYLSASEDMSIYEETDESSREVGSLKQNAVAYLIEDVDDDWAFVESGDVRGFVLKDQMVEGAVDAESVEAGTTAVMLAETLVDLEDNSAVYYSLKSVEKADETALLRENIVSFALQFIGNPYVWGGTSLTNGADCSGFVQSVYAHFGIYLPRVACDQAGYGQQIPVEYAQPGDLVFYAKNGYVYHVAMYIGNGLTVQAYGRRYGIISKPLTGSEVWATRVIG